MLTYEVKIKKKENMDIKSLLHRKPEAPQPLSDAQVAAKMQETAQSAGPLVIRAEQVGVPTAVAASDTATLPVTPADKANHAVTAEHMAKDLERVVANPDSYR